VEWTVNFSNRIHLFLLIGYSAFLAPRRSAGDSNGEATGKPVPFTLEATENVSPRFPGAPQLQSFAWAQWDGKWIFIGGRTAGYHGVGGKDADFPRAGANEKIWVVDPSAQGLARAFSFPVASLPASLGPVKNQWTSTSTLFAQDGDTLYIAGGYGQNAQGSWVTYPILSAVNLPALIEGVTKGRNTFSGSIAYTESDLVQSTGGELVKLDKGLFYLVGGHVFMGTYREFEASEEKNTTKASQTYLGEIRKLSVRRDARGQLSVALAERYRDPEFARRDLNAAVTILPDGHSLGAAAYGGVFTKDQLGFTKPIYWTSASPPKVDDSFEQKMSAYTCAKLLLFDPDANTMYSTFFGGISGWTWNYGTKRFELAPRTGDKTKPVYFDGMAWIDQITTLVRSPRETFEAVQPSNRLAAHLGTNAAFLPTPGLQKIREDANVFDLRALRGRRILVGYLYGGIRAFPREFPYLEDSPAYSSGNVPTKTSDMIIAVYLTVPPAK
jgi:hypothetical protein